MSKTKESLKSPLSKARGLGAAKEGHHHWKMQRISAIAAAPLVIWFVYSIVMLVNAPYEKSAHFLENPINVILMIFLIVVSFYHSILGLQVVVEDYVSCKAKRFVTLLLIKGTLIFLGATSVLAIIKMHTT